MRTFHLEKCITLFSFSFISLSWASFWKLSKSIFCTTQWKNKNVIGFTFLFFCLLNNVLWKFIHLEIKGGRKFSVFHQRTFCNRIIWQLHFLCFLTLHFHFVGSIHARKWNILSCVLWAEYIRILVEVGEEEKPQRQLALFKCIIPQSVCSKSDWHFQRISIYRMRVLWTRSTQLHDHVNVHLFAVCCLLSHIVMAWDVSDTFWTPCITCMLLISVCGHLFQFI